MHKLELPCRILLIIHCVLTLTGYISFIQTDHQLVSPLIPSSTVFLITRQSILAGFAAGTLLIPSLLFYFFQKRVVVIITSSAAIICYLLLANDMIII